MLPALLLELPREASDEDDYDHDDDDDDDDNEDDDDDDLLQKTRDLGALYITFH